VFSGSDSSVSHSGGHKGVSQGEEGSGSSGAYMGSA